MDLKINESKLLEFNAVIEGGDAGDIVGKLRIDTGDVEFGFPVQIDGKVIKAKIPPLKDYVKESKLRQIKNVSAKLDIVAKGKLFTPWKDNINLEIPLEVKAEMTGMKEFLDEADNIIKISKVKEKDVVDESRTDKKEEPEVDKVDETKKKIKSRFSIMLEEKKCPEGEKW
jgi:hypothetical protein